MIKKIVNLLGFKLLKFLGFLLASVLTLLNLTSCSYDNISCEYGCPYSELKINGTVISNSASSPEVPVKNIKVSIVKSKDDYLDGNLEVFTDDNGNYFLDFNNRPKDISLKLLFEDVDGIDNGGKFRSSEETITINESDYTGQKDWFQGKAEKTLNKKLCEETH